MESGAVVLDRVETARGELVLRLAGGRYEIISNGVFLMDTSDGTSERLLVDAALDACRASAPRVLIGGLGVGFSLVEALSHRHVAAVDVAEVEPTVIGWHHAYLRDLTGDALADSRVRLITADILAFLASEGADRPARYDAICLDTDNGPDWLVFDGNADIYADRGFDLLTRSLAPDGVLAVWGARRDPGYEQRLGGRFAQVAVHEIPHLRGVPDVIYIARAPT